jgi:NAD(P)H-hydrate epimerase
MMHPLESKVLDINSAALGVSTSVLMENAGKAVADNVLAMNIDGRVLIVCGPGNNGGDGAQARRDVTVALTVPKESVKSQLMLSNIYHLSRMVKLREDVTPEMAREFPIIIDAMLGTGLRSEPREPYSTWIKSINSSGARVISVDVPTGLGTSLAVKPELTVTFHDSKEGMDAKNSGRIVIADIGIPAEAAIYTGPGELAHYPVPEKNSHKGQNGRLLIIGGGPYAGAPALSAFAAQAIGADLVTIASPESSASVISSYSPNFIVRPLEGKILDKSHIPYIMELAGDADAVLIGPGLGRADETVKAVREILRKLDKPATVDADGLFAMAGAKISPFKVPAVLTPHAREFAGLGGPDEPTPEAVDEIARKFNATVLLKRPIDIISDGKNRKLNRTGNPGMTVGGTGDVLAGIVAGLMAKKVAAFNAARIGAYISGYAGDVAFESLGYSMTATDVVACIPSALKRGLDKL